MNEAHLASLQAMRQLIRDRKKVATCVGFGPRFLHFTGQAYKGGPNSGVFLQLTCNDAVDLSVPGQQYTFGIVKAAQARGDFQVLVDLQRRALWVHLGKDVHTGLATLRAALTEALKYRLKAARNRIPLTVECGHARNAKPRSGAFLNEHLHDTQTKKSPK